MTAAVARGTASLAAPQTQNSAPVHSFRCLFTHDIRRKQKRWQDGTLKFHTFNKRVMVYDDASNFIGDTHYKEGGGLHVGDEVHLDEGILVEVGESTGTSKTDLTPLFERERRKPEGSNTQLSSPAGPQMSRDAVGTPLVQRKHRSLNALLGAPRGSYGRATLPQSPYDVRHGGAENELQDNSRAKRRKIGEGDSHTQPWSITRVSKPQKETPIREKLLWARTTYARGSSSTKSKKNATTGNQRGLLIKEVVDITSDNEGAVPEIEEGVTSDVTLPSTSPPRQSTSNEAMTLQPRPAMKMARKSKTVARPSLVRPLLSSSPPVNTRNQIKDVQHHFEAEQAQQGNSSPEQRKPVYKTLRLAKSQPRPMLLCQPLRKPPVKPVQATSRGTRQDPFELFDVEEDAIARAVTKPGKKSKPVLTAARHAMSGVFPRRAAHSPDENRNSRTSYPALSTKAQCAEYYEAPSPVSDVVPNISIGPAMAKAQQAKQNDPAQHDQLAMGHRVIKRHLSSAKAAGDTSRTMVPRKTAIDVASNLALDRPFRRVQSANDVPMAVIDADDFDCPPTITEDRSIPTRHPKPMTKKNREKTPKQALQRSVSLSNTTLKSKPETIAKTAAPVKDQEIGAWTIEATDLFDWRPPNWDARETRKKAMAKAEAKQSCRSKK
jgi:hypothetical protein